MKTAVIYARYSSERQTEQSIEGQLRVCQDFADKNDIQILDTYIDRAMTGTNDNRAAFQQMLSDSDKSVPWDIVLVYAIDRFGRNSIEVAINKQRLQKNGKILISATQRTSTNIDGTKNLDGILLESVLVGIAEYYSAELSQKIRRGLHESREKGFYSGGIIPYGYKVKDKKVYIDEDRANIVRYIYQEYLSGKIVREIIADLTEKGVFYKGKPFVQNTVYKILRLEKYIGICRYDDGVYDNIFPAIVPKEIFDAIQTILQKNKIGSRSEDTDFLLRSKLICGYCGKNLQGDSGTSKSGKVMHYYKCMGRKKEKICNKSIIPKDKLEQLIIDASVNLFGGKENRDFLADMIMEVHEKRLHDQSLLKMLKEDKDQTEKSIANIMKAIEQGVLTQTTKSRLNELEEHLQDINAKILIGQYNEQRPLKKSDVLEYMKHTIKKETKLMIQMLIQKIVLYDDKVEIFYNYTDKKNPDDDHRDSSFTLCSDGSNQCPPNEQAHRKVCFLLR